MAGRFTESKRLPWWQALLLPLCLVSILFSGVTVLRSIPYFRSNGLAAGGEWRRALDGLVSPSTAQKMEEDHILQTHYAAVVDATAEATQWLAERYPSQHLEQIRNLLSTYAQEVHNRQQTDSTGRPRNQRRSLASFFGLGSSSSAADSSSILSGIGSALKNGLSGIGNDLLGDVAGAGMFLGIGIGQGTSSGLNLTTAAKAKLVAAKVASDSGMNSTGLNPAIQNLGSGLSGTLAGSIDIKSLAGGVNIAPAALGLATGIGNGAVTGFKLKNVTMPMPMNSTNASLADIAGMFGFGLTSTVTENIDLSTLGSGVMTAQLMAQLPGAALGLAQGLGNGAVSGLKVNTAVAPPTGTNVPDIAGSFGFGLSQSVAGNVNLSSLGGSAATLMMVMQYLPPAASGFGKGLGEGVPIGLGIQPDPGMIPMQMMPNGSIDVSGVAENFAMGLTSRVLANGTLSKLMSMQSSGGGMLANVDIGKAAGGFARGFLQGAGDSIQAVGGVQSLLAGNSTAPDAPVIDTPVQFNDSINGAAVGFGQGLGGQGVLVVRSLMGQTKIVTQKRDLHAIEGSPSTDVVPLMPRQTDVVVMSNGTTTYNLSALLDTESISTFLQKGIDMLTCEGVGGLGLIALGLVKSGTIPVDAQSTGNLAQFKDMIPKGIIHFTNEGNTYEIDTEQVLNGLNSSLITAANGVVINGNKIPAFAGFLVAHLILGIFIMLIVLPLILGVESARNMLVSIRKPHLLTWVPKWTNITWFLIIAPSLILIILFGVLTMGNAAHFRTGHGIFGLLTIIDGLAAVAFQYGVKLFGAPPGQDPTLIQKARTINNQVLLGLAAAAALTGFTDLSKIAVCITQVVPFELAISIGFGIANMYVIGSTLTQLEVYLAYRSGKMKKKQQQQNQAAGISSYENEKGGMKQVSEFVS